jgi:hypothetical protein
VIRKKYVHILTYPVLTVQNCVCCQSIKQEIHFGIFLDLICNANDFMSDTSYTANKLDHTAQTNRRSYYRAKRM